MFVLIVTVVKINNKYPTPNDYINLKISSTTNTIIKIGVPNNIDKIV